MKLVKDKDIILKCENNLSNNQYEDTFHNVKIR